MKSKADVKTSRVLMAKAEIPYGKITPKFIERFPEFKGMEQKISDTLRFRCINNDILEALELWAKEFNK